MKIYAVGGAVRDLLLGRIPSDHDWVVVGATEEEFLEAFPNARKVGVNFPVFIVDGEEYALARKERKINTGHKGFVCEFDPSVTLYEDLMRRDLTINAVAMDKETGVIFMAPGAYEDFKFKRLRHVSFAFTEDPLRVYRVARFAAQLPDFYVAPETLVLMHSMKKELQSLPAERVLNELKKALSAPKPSRFFEVLKEAAVLDAHFPEIKSLIGIPAGKKKHKGQDVFMHTMKVIDQLPPVPVLRFAGLCHDLGKALTPKEKWPSHHNHDKLGKRAVLDLTERLKMPADWRKAGLMACYLHMKAHRLLEMRPGRAVKLLRLLSRFPVQGVKGFLGLCVMDGMPKFQAARILKAYYEVEKVRLPEKYHNLGPKSGSVLLQMQAEKWKEVLKQTENKCIQEGQDYKNDKVKIHAPGL